MNKEVTKEEKKDYRHFSPNRTVNSTIGMEMSRDNSISFSSYPFSPDQGPSSPNPNDKHSEIGKPIIKMQKIA